MRMLKGQGYLAAALAALVLGSGVWALLSLFEGGKGLPSDSNTVGQEQAPSLLDATERAKSSRPLTSGAPRLERGGMLETPPSEVTLDLGELLDADGGVIDASIGSANDPVSIGPDLSSDDPLAYEPGSPSTPPRNLGAPLDADDPGSSPLTDASPRIIGISLNADEPLGWQVDQRGLPPIEIGERIDAGAPMTR
ncbi:MAG: hypothetical protein ACK2U2_03645 [Anaerolineae bacterium]